MEQGPRSSLLSKTNNFWNSERSADEWFIDYGVEGNEANPIANVRIISKKRKEDEREKEVNSKQEKRGENKRGEERRG